MAGTPSMEEISWYARTILPRLVHLACGLKTIRRQRQKVVPLAKGVVLEVGIGTGLNLPHYDAAQVHKVYGLEPSAAMRARAAEAARSVAFEVELLAAKGQEIPLAADSVDSIVMTYTLCSIAEPGIALREMARVLRPGGRLHFCEHGAAPDESVRRWQDRLTPLWCCLSGGCHLNRAIPQLIEQGGFRIAHLQTLYLPGWRAASFNYWGAAVPA